MLKSAKIAILTIALGTSFANAQNIQTLTVAGGCFWCVESDFEKVDGVKEVVSGFTGGSVSNPSYKQVVGGKTGHREAVQIMFEPSKVSRDALLDKFLRSIDPTDAGGQFCDRGFTYSTAIYVATSEEEKLAKEAIAKASMELGQSIVTQIEPLRAFFPAEAYHQDYYKSTDRVITRFGVKTKAEAYKRYRKGCGRDARVRALWGSSAPFVGGS